MSSISWSSSEESGQTQRRRLTTPEVVAIGESPSSTGDEERSSASTSASGGTALPSTSSHSVAETEQPVAYAWVRPAAWGWRSKYNNRPALKALVSSVRLVDETIRGRSFELEGPSSDEQVFMGRFPEDEGEFFYVYDCFFRRFHLRLPFGEFFEGVLTLLNAAPTQVHPNVWGLMQAFKILCEALCIRPTPALFLHHYLTRPGDRVGWLSLISRENVILGQYSQSLKNFKTGFLKICPTESGRELFFKEDGCSPRFPFYWTRSPVRYDEYPVNLMTEAERRDLRVLNRLPRPIPAVKVVQAGVSSHPVSELIGDVRSG